VYFRFFIFGKLTELHCFVTYLWNDPRINARKLVCSVHCGSLAKDELTRDSTYKHNKEMAAAHLMKSCYISSLLYACEIWSLKNSTALLIFC